VQIVEYRRGDRASLKDLIRRERAANTRDRLRAVAMALDGDDAPTIARTLGRSRRSVQQWVYTYRDGGLDAVRPKPRPGRRSFLSEQERRDLVKRLRAGPAEAEALSAFRGEDVGKLIESMYGKAYSLSGIYYLLHSLGFEQLVPRPRHPGHDPRKAKEFVRRRAPLV